MNNSSRPNFSKRVTFLVGAQKAGTTTLAFLLDQHPDIHLSSPKETQFFSDNFDKGLDWYQSHFPDRETGFLLDASTSYTMADPHRDLDNAANFAAQRIRDFSPQARLIYLFRNPVDRAYSAYLHNARFRKPMNNFLDALKRDSSFVSPGQYYFQSQRLIDYFPLEQILFVDFDILKTFPEAVTALCCEYLGLSAQDSLFRLDAPKNASFKLTTFGTILSALFQARHQVRTLNEITKRLLPITVRDFLKRSVIRKTETMPFDVRDRAFELFAEDWRLFHEFLLEVPNSITKANFVE